MKNLLCYIRYVREEITIAVLAAMTYEILSYQNGGVHRKYTGSAIYRPKRRSYDIVPLQCIVLYKKPCIKLKPE